MENDNKYYIKVISPVSVGSGATLSPLVDYILYEDDIMYIDGDKLAKLLDDNDLIDAFSDKVRRVHDRDKTSFLRNFLINDASIEPEVVADFSIPHNFDSYDNPVEISQIIKTNQNAYIPGSSVKGALRTYILYNWMKTHPIKIEEFINEIDRIHPIFINQIRNLQGRELNRIRKKVCKETDRWFKTNIEDKCFNEAKNDNSSIMQFLNVSDTINNSKTSWSVYQSERVHLRNGERVVSTPREAISENNVLEIEIKRITTEHRPESYKLTLMDELWKIINTINYELITHEIEIWEGCKYNFEDESYAEQIIDFYKQLLKDLSKGKRIICIGFGKTYYLNSIGLIFKQNDPGSFKKLREVYGMDKEGQKFFPVTRTVCYYNEINIPMGWVEIMNETELQKDSKNPQVEIETTIPNRIIKQKEAVNVNPILENFNGTIEIGTTLSAKITKIGKPHSQVDLMVNGATINVQMTGTKTASKLKQLEGGMVFYVEVTSMKNNVITQVKFKSFEK
jgi:CRISPR type III-A-associated RAMP protein Csm5